MPERPLLKLPQAEVFRPRARGGGGAGLVRPSRGRQRNRLQPRFGRLMQIAGDPQRLLSLRNDPASIAPERAIVFEVAGSLKDFYAQAKNLGLEYLGDFEDEFTPDDDFHHEERPERKIGGRIYLAACALGLRATGFSFYDDEVGLFLGAAGMSAMFLVAVGR